MKINDLFEVSYGTKLDFNKMIISNDQSLNTINFVSRTSKNNGVICKVSQYQDVEPLEEGLITVTLGGTYLLSAFIQPEKFYTAQNVAVLKPKVEMSFNEKLYYCLCISHNRFRYGAFGREANRTLRYIEIPERKDIPSWIEQSVDNTLKASAEPFNKDEIFQTKLELSSWKAFKYEQLFDIERGRGPRRKDLNDSGTVPFITSTDSNNGLTGYTTEQPCHPGNVIGVNRNGSVAEAFYQPIPFCSTEDVHIFKPKFNMNVYIAMFLITLIRKEKYRYSYGRKWGIDRMNNSIIKLPVTEDGAPDWAYMENYIKSLPFSSKIE